MEKIILNTFHRGLSPERYDEQRTSILISELLEKGYDVDWNSYNGDDNFEFKGVRIDQGSIAIIELPKEGTFKLIDNGDAPTLSYELCKKEGFDGAVIGQYNRKKWEQLLSDSEDLFKKVLPGNYQETYWNFGGVNRWNVQQYRDAQKPLDKFYWRGSTYQNHPNPNYRDIRECLHQIQRIANPSKISFNPSPLAFMVYIQEALEYSIVTSLGGGGGIISGDLCFRDIEMFGLGIPVIRPQLAVQTRNPLIPDYHYIAIPTEFTEEGKYANHEKLAEQLLHKCEGALNNPDILMYISENAMKWYDENYANNSSIKNDIIDLGL